MKYPCENWKSITEFGLPYGYFANTAKTWLIVKVETYSVATKIFGDTETKITSRARPHLSVHLGTHNYFEQFVKKKVKIWINNIQVFAS